MARRFCCTSVQSSSEQRAVRDLGPLGTPWDDESESGNAALRPTLASDSPACLLIDFIVLQVYTKNNPIYNPEKKNIKNLLI